MTSIFERQVQRDEARASLNGYLKLFMPASQIETLLDHISGEESVFFVETVNDLTSKIKAMPVTYQTDGQGKNAIVHLHYFRGRIDAWITERDVGVAFDDGTRDDTQVQAFGCVSMGYGPELGYVAISELIANGAELDMCWEPVALKDLK